jgi:hypothetical protein
MRSSWPLGCWDRGFESRSRHGYLSLCLCRVGLCDELITSPKESYHASSKIRRPKKGIGKSRQMLESGKQYTYFLHFFTTSSHSVHYYVYLQTTQIRFISPSKVKSGHRPIVLRIFIFMVTKTRRE